jgi:nucleotide-binding universal stress UspA family protein
MTRQTTTGQNTVMLALDGSPAAASALPLARTVAGQLGAHLAILHIAGEEAPDADLWRRLHLQLGPGETVRVRSRAGAPAAAILQAAREAGVELMVLTTHGRVIEPGRSLGGVAREVVAHTTRPLLLVRPEAVEPDTTPTAPLRHLLLPLDGTPTTTTALQPAAEFACRLGAAIDLLYVASPDEPQASEPGGIGAPRYIDQPHHEWPEWAERVIGHLSVCLGSLPPDTRIQVFFAVGGIAHEIARFAAEHGSDAIVLVRRSHLEVGRARILRAVLDRTSCPVLLVSHG